MTFSDKLTFLRRQRGISQEQLADILNVSRQAVGKWESGRSMPDLDKLIILADFFNVTLDDLIRDQSFHAKDVDKEQFNKTDSEPSFYQASAADAAFCGRRFLRTYIGGYEYKSNCKLLGIPLVHINVGWGYPRVARGVFALGNIAVGGCAVGGLSAGIISIGGLGLGLLAVGGIAAGAIALGGLALGFLALGGLAVGVYAIGGCAIGLCISAGGAAFAPFSIGANENATVVLSEHFNPEKARQLLEQCQPQSPLWIKNLFGLFLS